MKKKEAEKTEGGAAPRWRWREWAAEKKFFFCIEGGGKELNQKKGKNPRALQSRRGEGPVGKRGDTPNGSHKSSLKKKGDKVIITKEGYRSEPGVQRGAQYWKKTLERKGKGEKKKRGGSRIHPKGLNLGEKTAWYSDLKGGAA